MTRFELRFGDEFVVLEASDDDAADLLRWVFPTAAPTSRGDTALITVTSGADGGYTVAHAGEHPEFDAGMAAAALSLSGQVTDAVAMVTEGLVLHAAAVERDGAVVIVAGATGSGKTTAALRLVADGWRIATDELVWLGPGGEIDTLLRPLGVKRPAELSVLTRLGVDVDGDQVRSTQYLHLVDPRALPTVALSGRAEVVAIVLPAYDRSRHAEVRRLSPVEATERMLPVTRLPSDDLRAGFARLAGLTRDVPAVEIVGSELDRIAEIVDAVTSGRSDRLDGDTSAAEPTALPETGRLDDLSRAAIHHGAREWTLDRTTPRYARALGPRRLAIERVLHLTAGATAARDPDRSLAMWRDHLPNATVVGVLDPSDDPATAAGERVETLIVEHLDTVALSEIADQHGPFDLIVDDATRGDAAIRSAFDVLFPLLRDHGTYAIERLDATYWPEMRGDDAPGAPVAFVAELLGRVHDAETWAVDESAVPRQHGSSIAEVTVTRGLALVERGANRRRSHLIARADDPATAQAIDTLTRSTDSFPDGRAEVALARLYAELRHAVEALEWARAALAAGSTDAWAMRLVADAVVDGLPGGQPGDDD